MDASSDMLAVCLVDLSSQLQRTMRAYHAALPPPLRAEFPFLVARVEAEAAQLAATTWRASLMACQAGLVMAEAFERDGSAADLDQLYWQWLRLTQAALGQESGQPGGGAS